MSFNGYEDQRLPRELDDYEYGQINPGYELCDVCGDRIAPWCEITVNGNATCSSQCAAMVVAELWSAELAARPAPEDNTPWPVLDDETAPISVRIDGVSYRSMADARRAGAL